MENKLKTYSIVISIVTIILLITIISLLFIKKEKITKLEAQNIAYEYANIEKKDITNIKIKKEIFDDEYEIEFITKKYKYEFEIDSRTGRIINFEKDLINKESLKNDNKENNTINFSEKEAKKIALNHANLNENDVTFTKIKIDRENGKTVYEIDFFDDNNEYEIYIDISTKKISKYSKKPLKLNTTTDTYYINKDKVKQLVLDHAKLNEDNIIWHKVELDIDYNIKTYEIEFFYNNLQYEYEVDAINGSVLKYEIDRD